MNGKDGVGDATEWARKTNLNSQMVSVEAMENKFEFNLKKDGKPSINCAINFDINRAISVCPLSPKKTLIPYKKV